MSKHLFLSHHSLLDHHGTSRHPENSSRLQAILEAFAFSPFNQFLNLSCARQATVDELLLIHDQSYIDLVLSLDGKRACLDPETPISPGSVKAALLAAGLGLEVVEQIVGNRIQNGFALLRPPGHHARPSLGMGFCIFNNIAIAAKKALSQGIKRILILDWDVHHGNGTQEAFYDTDSVLFIDLHQENLFPVSSGLISEKGKDRGLGSTVNIPLPPHCRDEDYLYIFDAVVSPLALKYEPELILVSAGFDAHESDPLGFMKLTTEGYGLLTKRVINLAHKVCGGRLAFFLEGGYNPYFLAKNVMECVQALCQPSSSEEIRPLLPSKEVVALIEKHYVPSM